MTDIRYTILVGEEFVKIEGTITIEEAFDFLNFYDRKGYDCLLASDESSTIYMAKRKSMPCYDDLQENDLQNEIPVSKNTFFEAFYEEEKRENEKLRQEISKLLKIIKLFEEREGKL